MAAEPFVDTHVHFWDHSVQGLRWPWLEKSFEHPRLKGMHRLDAPRFGPAELRSEAGDAAPAKIVHVQCAGPTDEPATETEWLETVAKADGWPNAIVSACRLRHPDAGAVIEGNAVHPRFRGVRDMSVVDDVEPAEVAAAFDAAQSVRGAVELLVPYRSYGSIRALANRWPLVTIVLGHAGQPVERSPEYFQRWSAALRELAADAPNVVVKVSAIASASDPDWSTESIRPWVLACIEAFGADRAMLATNWPVDRLYGAYADVVAAYRTITAGLPAGDRTALFHATAERVYRI